MTSPFYSLFDKNVTDFYSWIIQKEQDVIVGSALKNDHRANQRFALLINDLKERGVINGNAIKREGTLVMRTRKLNQIHLTHENIAMIGEAAGLISPSSAEGISYALKSAEYLADALNHDMTNFTKRYNSSCRSLKVNLLLKNIKLIAMYQPFIRRLIMKSGVIAMKVRD